MTTEEWLDLIRLYDKDKTTVKDFCSAHSISAASFYKYRRMENETSGEKFLGHEFTKTVQKTTGNLIISETDFKKLDQALKHGRMKEEQLNKILDTDIHKENKELKDTVKELKAKTNEVIDDYNLLVKDYNSLIDENKGLRATISDLREEIRLIYISTKEFLKDRTSDLKAFKEVFKELADSISNSSREKGLDSNFKKEFDKENKKNRTRGMSR